MTDISKAKSSAGDEIIRGLTGLRDALATEEPLADRFAVHTVKLDLEPRTWTPAQVRKLRARFQASQSVFAKLIGASVKTVQAWEQGGQPPAMASRLLECIERFPEPWEDMLRRSAVATVRRAPSPRAKKKSRTARVNSRHGQAK
jgi:putative transcriptional regulator